MLTTKFTRHVKGSLQVNIQESTTMEKKSLLDECWYYLNVTWRSLVKQRQKIVENDLRTVMKHPSGTPQRTFGECGIQFYYKGSYDFLVSLYIKHFISVWIWIHNFNQYTDLDHIEKWEDLKIGVVELDVGERLGGRKGDTLINSYKVFLSPLCLRFIIIIIIIMMSRHQHGSPWPSLATLLYRPSFPVGLQDYILYRHRAVVCMS